LIEQERNKMALTNPSKRALIYDYHPAISKGLSGIINFELNMDVVQQPCNSKKLLRVLDESDFDLLLLDMFPSDKNSFDLIRRIISENSDLKVLVISNYDSDLYTEEAISAGAKGFIMMAEPIEEILKAIVIVLDNGIYRNDKTSD